MSRLVRSELEGSEPGRPDQPNVQQRLGAGAAAHAVRGHHRVGVLAGQCRVLCSSHGSHVMETSNSVGDWEQAWEEYLEPLNTRFPDHPYQDKVEEYRQQDRRRPRRLP